MDIVNDNTSHFMPKQMHLSLADLSMELKSLGMKPLAFNDCHDFAELCESLLSSTWTLVNLVHGRAMGFTDAHENTSDKEAMLRSENQSLEVKIENLKTEIKNSSMTISKERENARQLEGKLKRKADELKQEKLKSSQLLTKLEAQEKDFKHTTIRQEAEMEELRKIIQKSMGVCHRQHSVPMDRLGGAIESLTLAKGTTDEVAELQQSTLNRLKSVNCTLVEENLMLRDALKMLHSDLNSFLTVFYIETEGAEFPNCSLPANIFHFPLSYSMNKLRELRQQQLHHLKILLQKESENLIL